MSNSGKNILGLGKGGDGKIPTKLNQQEIKQELEDSMPQEEGLSHEDNSENMDYNTDFGNNIEFN